MRLLRKVFEFVSGKGLGAESVRYVIVGGVTTLVNFGLFELLWGVFGIDVTISNVASIFAAIIFAYIANKLIVFRCRSDSKAALMFEFSKFVGSRLFTMALEVGAVFLLHNTLMFDARLSKVSSLVFVMVTNFVINKVIVFRTGKAEGD